MKKIGVLISGTGSNLKAIINNCNNKNINASISFVISDNPEALGLQIAKENGILIKVINFKEFKKRKDFDQALLNFLSSNELDLIVLAGFMKILPRMITDKFKGRIVNIHPSILPKYPGTQTHAKVMKNNDRFHGVSIHFVNEILDSGQLIAQGIINTKPNQSESNLIKRIHKVEHLLYPKVIKYLCENKIYLEDDKVIYNLENETYNQKKNLMYVKYNEI
ncbi:phosphoribosylglycinamide formyltransferase [SAR86 cluster bacterium]|nr:phosphoribosylglycinamide formyltransferase [SAR86 cluster bacterium]|tara:strand:+ start:104 stop:766 length:663 start_codon:yes stop_codon:yes gene_type:complete